MTSGPIAIGAAVGAVLAGILYATNPTYAAFINWQFAHPLVWLAVPVGVGLALLTDSTNVDPCKHRD